MTFVASSLSAALKKTSQDKEHLKRRFIAHEKAPRHTALLLFSHRADFNETMTEHRPRKHPLRPLPETLFSPQRVHDLVRVMQITHMYQANHTEWIYSIRAPVTQVQLT